MRFEGQPAGEGEGGLFVLGEVFPVGVEGAEVVIGQADGEQLRFLVAEAVLAVIGPRGDPEEFGFEAVIECDGGIGLEGKARGRAAGAAGGAAAEVDVAAEFGARQLQGAQAVFVAAGVGFFLGRLQLLCGEG
ncbi:MAG: hypothetical protein ACK5UC_00020, partial [Planctomycetaceae bacterium]